jgi:succinate-acetate transporter protein
MDGKKTLEDFLRSLLSRKLLVFAVAVVLLIVGKITESTWLIVAMGYMGINAAMAAVDAVKTAKAKVETGTTVATKSSKLTETKLLEEKEGEA